METPIRVASAKSRPLTAQTSSEWNRNPSLSNLLLTECSPKTQSYIGLTKMLQQRFLRLSSPTLPAERIQTQKSTRQSAKKAFLKTENQSKPNRRISIQMENGQLAFMSVLSSQKAKMATTQKGTLIRSAKQRSSMKKEAIFSSKTLTVQRPASGIPKAKRGVAVSSKEIGGDSFLDFKLESWEDTNAEKNLSALFPKRL